MDNDELLMILFDEEIICHDGNFGLKCTLKKD
jgi:hypothetical protein